MLPKRRNRTSRSGTGTRGQVRAIKLKVLHIITNQIRVKNIGRSRSTWSCHQQHDPQNLKPPVWLFL
ncbi:hypothetical protein Hanom_Chr04g00385051 [Helianthus anomalus]